MTKQRPAYDLGSDGTYIVVGGLGGLGLVMARWLVSRGARNLVLLSRSGPRTSEAKEAIAEFNTQGVCVAAPLCDATDNAAVQSMLTTCGQTMPPVKGCILASMVLNVSSVLCTLRDA
jgi:NAD(P)-dependent dehydrogenase (short-subunit alcohol dehydrogenase family)